MKAQLFWVLTLGLGYFGRKCRDVGPADSDFTK